MFSSRHIEVVRSSSKNDCGPCAVAMVLGAFEGKRVTAREAAREMRFWRVPGIGATLPRGITSTLRRHGLKTAGGWFGRIQDIKAHVDADHPVIVLTRPTDLPHAPFFSLHYRVV
ncbi:MAG: hypothetical protein M1343_08610, partial [Chloroflexi bacterium]|nr:hypothetical protein [Chloroflexota bacterium]